MKKLFLMSAFALMGVACWNSCNYVLWKTNHDSST